MWEKNFVGCSGPQDSEGRNSNLTVRSSSRTIRWRQQQATRELRTRVRNFAESRASRCRSFSTRLVA